MIINVDSLFDSAILGTYQANKLYRTDHAKQNT